MGLISDELMEGDVIGHMSRNPGSTAGSLIGLAIPGIGSLGSIAGRAYDSYNQSVEADRALSEDIGINPEGPDIGRSRTTSAVRDYLGDDARDQKGDIRDAAETFYNKSQVFDPSLAQGDIYGPGMVTSTPGLAAPVAFVDTTPTYNAPTQTANGAFYNSGPKGVAARSLWQNPNDPTMGQQYSPMDTYMGAENMSVDDYTGSAQQDADIAAAQDAFDNDAGGGSMDADGEGGDDWGDWGDWGSDAY